MITPVHEAARDTVEVGAAEGVYPVFVGPDLLEHLPVVLSTYAPTRRVAVISDDEVGPIHGASVATTLADSGHDVTVLTFPAGEASKTRTSWSILTDGMLEAGLGRDCVVVAVGGGVTTDLAGFVAATYLRGVPIVHVPTSTLAMIDASVGGKTGVDVHAGKNLVGAFHAPRAVVADTTVLATLERARRAEGLVEAVKHGAIRDEAHFGLVVERAESLIAAEPMACAEVVAASVRLKAEVVAQDEFEEGVRQILNFGHTIGHAIEAAADYRIGHGRAVACGMIAEARLGEGLGVTEAGTAACLIEALAPLTVRGEVDLDPTKARDFLGADKKSRDGQARYVLLRRIGEVARDDGWTHEIDDEAAHAALEAVVRGW
jgi:3-dehydroquinate synthase